MDTLTREPLNNATSKQYAVITAAAIADEQAKKQARITVESMLHGSDHRRAVVSALIEGRQFSVIQASKNWTDLFVQGRA